MGTLKEQAASSQTLSSSSPSVSNGAAGYAGAVLDNTGTLGFWYDFLLNVTFGASTGGGQPVYLYLVPALDGTNYAEINGANFQPDHYAGAFVTPASDTGTTMYLTVQQVYVGPYKYKAYVLNSSGQSIGSGWALTAFPVQNQY